MVLESKFGSPRIVNDGVTVAKEVELEDPVENIGAKLVRQASRHFLSTAMPVGVASCILSGSCLLTKTFSRASEDSRR